MSRPSSSFFRTSAPLSSKDRSQSPLLPLHEHRSSVSLQDLSPRSSHSPEGRASPSPSPSFYRDALSSTSKASSFAHPYSDAHPAQTQTQAQYQDQEPERDHEHEQAQARERDDRERTRASLSPSSTTYSTTYTQSHNSSPVSQRRKKKLMFAAPPPPIAASMYLTPEYTTLSSASSGAHAYNTPAGDRSSRGSSQTRGLEVLGPPLSSTAGSSTRRGIDPLSLLARREKGIQRNLQGLLDAQSTGLLHGFGGGGGGGNGGGSEAGSNTPTNTTRSGNGNGNWNGTHRGSSSNGRGITPVRQPKPVKPLGLRGARRGLLKEMEELVLVKEEESQVLSDEIVVREGVLQKLHKWEERITGVKGKLRTFEDAGEEEGLKGLKREESAIDNEIAEMEERLLLLKTRKRMLGERIREGVNKREAEMSSYRGALREAEGEVREFLRRTPLSSSAVEKMPSNRKTLGLAKEHFTREIEGLEGRKEEVEKEKEASVQGVRLWRESCARVVQFEDALRVVISSQTSGNAETAVLKMQIERMGDVIEGLEGVSREAEGNGWNLLVCAVGAEVEAFRQGRGILMGALGFGGEEEKESDDNRGGSAHWEEERRQSGNGIDTGTGHGNGTSIAESEDEGIAKTRLIDESEDDEGPNLDLLIERSSMDDDTT